MTDFELNKAILPLLKLPKIWIELDGGYWEDATFDFNNWNDLMPLVVKYKLSSWQDEATGDWYTNQTKREMNGDYLCDRFENDIENEKLQRSYAECLLKVLQGEQGE